MVSGNCKYDKRIYIRKSISLNLFRDWKCVIIKEVHGCIWSCCFLIFYLMASLTYVILRSVWRVVIWDTRKRLLLLGVFCIAFFPQFTPINSSQKKFYSFEVQLISFCFVCVFQFSLLSKVSPSYYTFSLIFMYDDLIDVNWWIHVLSSGD